MRKSKLVVFIGSVLFSTAALAQVVISDLSVTVGSSSSTNCVGADAARKTLAINNTSGVNVGYCYRPQTAPSTPCTPSIGSDGTTTVPAGSLFYWPYGSAPINGMDCIAASSTAAVTISVGH